jgi:hypothetical protein
VTTGAPFVPAAPSAPRLLDANTPHPSPTAPPFSLGTQPAGVPPPSPELAPSGAHVCDRSQSELHPATAAIPAIAAPAIAIAAAAPAALVAVAIALPRIGPLPPIRTSLPR